MTRTRTPPSLPPNGLEQPLLVSAVAHLGLLALLFLTLPGAQRGESWGGLGGTAIGVTLVGSLPGVPLPRPPVVTQSRVATQSPGLHQTEPKPEPRPAEKAQAIPRFGKEARREKLRRPAEESPPQPPGAVPFGQGGAPALPYTTFQVGAGTGGMSFGGGEGFGSRYPWYVESVQRRVSSQWLQATIDPYVQWAPRVVVTFDILRNGTVVNQQMLRSSGVPSVDRSAIRAIQDSSPLDRLPSDYPGDRVAVEFWFDFRRP